MTPISNVLPWRKGTEEDVVKEAKAYREYAADCRRIAQLMSTKDKQTLLKMAEAWEARAQDAERKEGKGERET